MIKDIIVEEARRVQAELIKKYGGLDGWIDHLQEMDRQRLEKERKRKAEAKKKQAASANNSRNSAGDSRDPTVNGKKPRKKARRGNSRTVRK